MLGKLGIGQGLVFGLLVLMAALFVGLTITIHDQNTLSAMKASVVNSVSGVLGDAARRLEQHFARWVRAVEIRSYIEEDLYRPDLPYVLLPDAALNMDDPSLLQANLRTYRADYQNFTLPITFARSSYHIPYATPNSIHSFSAVLNGSIALNFLFDSIAVRQVSDAAGSIASLYAGSLQPARLFVEFPGVGATNVTAYDWTTDPESPIALDLKNIDGPVFSDAYVDPYVNQLEISIYRAFRNVTNWSEVGGAAGADFVLTDLRAIVDTLEFENISRAALFNPASDAVVIDSNLASMFSDPLVPDTDYRNGLYSAALTAAPGVYTDERDGYLYFAIQLSTDANSFVAINRVPTSFIDQRMSQIRTNDQRAGGIVAGALVAAILASLALAIGLINLAVLKVTRPLRHLTEVVSDIPRNHLGNASTLAGGLAVVPAPAPVADLVTEEQKLWQAVSAIVPVFNANRKLAEHPLNPDHVPQEAEFLLSLPASLVADEKAQDNLSVAKRKLMGASNAFNESVSAAALRGPKELTLATLQKQASLPLILVHQLRILAEQENDVAGAQTVARYILRTFPKLETSIHQTCKRMLDPNATSGDAKGNDSVRRILLVLDVSGSMGSDEPTRISQARDGMIGMLRNPKITVDNTEIGIFRFSDQTYPVSGDGKSVRVVRGPLEGPNHQSLENDIRLKTPVGGGTMLYAAINRAYDEINTWPPGPNNFVFVITDGIAQDDYTTVLARPAPNARVGIFIVGQLEKMEGGKAAADQLAQVVKKVGETPSGKPKGTYASLNDLPSIFTQIRQIILAGATNDEAF